MRPWNPYGSHVPVLRAIARSTTVRRVLEYGSGRYSTRAFLEPQHFPELEELVSLESSESWAKDTASRNRDYRLKVLLTSLDNFVNVEVGKSDIALIDCGESIQDYKYRAELLKRHQGDQEGFVVLHDVEDGGLMTATERSSFRFRRYFEPMGYAGPSTGVFSNRPIPNLEKHLNWDCEWPVEKPKNKVYACLTSRDGRALDEVQMALSAACSLARKMELCDYEMARVRDNYSAPSCRNKAVADFLKRPDFTHLWFVDDDVTVQPDALSILVSADKPIAAGGYPQVRHFKGERPSELYITVQVEEGWFRGWFDGEVKAKGAGTGCMLIKREVLEAVGFPWFRWPEFMNGNGEHSELSDDVDFCERARQKGFDTYAYGRVRCGHLKMSDLACWIGHAKDPLPVSGWDGPKTATEQLKREGKPCK